MGGNWQAEQVPRGCAAIEQRIVAPGNQPAACFTRQLPAIGSSPDRAPGAALMAEYHAMALGQCPVARQFNLRCSQDMGTSIPHQGLVNRTGNQCRNGRSPARLTHAADGIDPIFCEQGGDPFRVPAIGQRSIAADQLADRLAVFQGLKAGSEVIFHGSGLAQRRACGKPMMQQKGQP